MDELGEKSDGAPELLAVAEMRTTDDIARIPATRALLVTVFDRPSNPGNIGTLIRSIDAFGGSGLVITATPPTHTTRVACARAPARSSTCP
jgi:23S rRNA (uridine2479-2'-O)-methyltransferase